ncbi:hypothetical protein ILUMI_14102 [Ignelater luminosus]|uniref:Uncharacterized protein n=1 Tax=Ignelater luminosus TaxID=2038154 RepID=A0A8K0CUW5_IGNLU|nr:hypothetical protein ILUMI_14102 [Ignelater luminosus]
MPKVKSTVEKWIKGHPDLKYANKTLFCLKLKAEANTQVTIESAPASTPNYNDDRQFKLDLCEFMFYESDNDKTGRAGDAMKQSVAVSK